MLKMQVRAEPEGYTNLDDGAGLSKAGPSDPEHPAAEQGGGLSEPHPERGISKGIWGLVHDFACDPWPGTG